MSMKRPRGKARGVVLAGLDVAVSAAAAALVGGVTRGDGVTALTGRVCSRLRYTDDSGSFCPETVILQGISPAG
jgi:hypothetical protein